MKIFSFIKELFSSPRQVSTDPEELKVLFKKRYSHFRSLLTANNNALQSMAELERIYYSGESYRMALIRSKITSILVNVYKMIGHLREMVDSECRDLETLFDRIGNDLEKILEQKPLHQDGPLILSLAETGKKQKAWVGEKMASLGEIAVLPGIVVPHGFTVTAAATSRFLTPEVLGEINRRLQILDPDDLNGLHRTCQEIKQIVRDSPLPPGLEELLYVHYGHLEKLTRPGVKVAMRSSAIGEDSIGVSFAGLYRSVLNIEKKSLATAYKEVIAGKYGMKAITYRRKRGYRHEDIEMCVGCMAMVDALISGITYSSDPLGDDSDTVRINHVAGLASGLVRGTKPTNLYLISREKPHTLVYSEIRQNQDSPQPTTRSVIPTLTYSQMKKLAETAMTLEKHFSSPQDIEWSFDHQGKLYILQSRSIPHYTQQPRTVQQAAPGDRDEEVAPLLFGGICAAKGIACGTVVSIDSAEHLEKFPKGAILLIEHPLPEWTPFLCRASAVIAGHGSEAGHLATVAREFALPALFNLPEALTTLHNGQLVTVNASGRAIYSGCRNDLLLAGGAKRDLMAGSSVQRIVTEALEHITPLNLTDPGSRGFSSSSCETLHDITRFCHEQAVSSMFNFGRKYNFSQGAAKQLVDQVPLQWWIIDLADGVSENEDIHSTQVNIDNIVSAPMLAIWRGITAFPWQGPPRPRAGGFAAAIFQAAIRPELDPVVAPRLAAQNCFLISKNFCNLSVRLGYHFAMIESYLGELLTENYVTFRFKGGAMAMRHKSARAILLGEILTQFGFRIEQKADSLLARIKKKPMDFLLERLQILGYLIQHARQLDMAMDDPLISESYKQKFLVDIAEMRARRHSCTPRKASDGKELESAAG